MVTGLSKAWIGINNTPSELNMGTGRKETVLYDHTVNANINLRDSGGGYLEYYQDINFPDYVAAVGDEQYNHIYAEYTFIGDAYGTPIDYNSEKTAYTGVEIYYNNASGRYTNLHVFRYYNRDGSSTLYFNKASSRTILIARKPGVYGDDTYTGPGTYIVDFDIYRKQYTIKVKFMYGYTASKTIYNNNNIQHRVRIVGVI